MNFFTTYVEFTFCYVSLRWEAKTLPKVKSVHFRSLAILCIKHSTDVFPGAWNFVSKAVSANTSVLDLSVCSCINVVWGSVLQTYGIWLLTFRLSYSFMLTCVTHQFLLISAQERDRTIHLPPFLKITHFVMNVHIWDSICISKAFVCNIFLSTSSQNILGVVSCWDYPWLFC